MSFKRLFKSKLTTSQKYEATGKRLHQRQGHQSAILERNLFLLRPESVFSVYTPWTMMSETTIADNLAKPTKINGEQGKNTEKVDLPISWAK